MMGIILIEWIVTGIIIGLFSLAIHFARNAINDIFEEWKRNCELRGWIIKECVCEHSCTKNV
jgi:hypothetical protein